MLKIIHFEVMDNFMKMLIPLFPNCTVNLPDFSKSSSCQEISRLINWKIMLKTAPKEIRCLAQKSILQLMGPFSPGTVDKSVLANQVRSQQAPKVFKKWGQCQDKFPPWGKKLYAR